MTFKYIKNFDALSKLTSINKTVKLIFNDKNIAEALKVVYDNEEHILLFNHEIGLRGINNKFYNSKNRELIDSLLKKYNKFVLLEDDFFEYHTFQLLPNDLEEKLNFFLSQCGKKINEEIKACSNQSFCDEVDLIKIYSISNNSKNWFYWAFNNYCYHDVPLSLCSSIIYLSTKYKTLVHNVSKKTPLAYKGLVDILNLRDELIMLRKKFRVNNVINSFNTQQKKIFKSLCLNDELISILSKFYKLSQAKKKNFIQKISSINDSNDIIKQMKILTMAHFDWNKESFYQFITKCDNINCDVIYDNNNVMIVKINDFNTIKHIAKTTNWCISKNKRYWNGYVGNDNEIFADQYAIFDFNKKEDDDESIVGFTASFNIGITAAHSFSNKNIHNINNKCIYNQNINTFVKKRKSIKQLLSVYNLTESNFVKSDALLYDWNKQSFFDHLKVCFPNEYDYNILHNEDNLVIIETKSNMYRYLINNKKSYQEIGNDRIIMFFDFNKNVNDLTKIQYVFVYFDDLLNEEKTSNVFNSCASSNIEANFESLLNYYNIDYSIICRPNNGISKFLNTIINLNIDEIGKIIKDKTFKTELKQLDRDKKYLVQHTIADLIYNSIAIDNTLEIIDACYDNNLKLTTLIGSKCASELLESLLIDLRSDLHMDTKRPSIKDFKNLYDNQLDVTSQRFLGIYYAIFKILVNETKLNTISDSLLYIIKSINNLNKKIGNELISLIKPFINDNSKKLDILKL